jgi:hypothetical protein
MNLLQYKKTGHEIRFQKEREKKKSPEIKEIQRAC